MNKPENGQAAGIGFSGLLTIAFIVLKLTRVIDWKWIWVLAPAWIPLAILILVLIGIVAKVCIQEYLRSRKEKKTKK